MISNSVASVLQPQINLEQPARTLIVLQGLGVL